MINGRFQPKAITGYYEYLSTHRLRVDVAPHQKRGDEESMKKASPTTTNAENPSQAAAIVEDNEKQLASLENKDVTKWSSADVHRWVEEQCQKFELKKATTEKFQMNGQALVLLTKHDFLRRSPDGGEILYYALQKLINPKKFNPARINQNRSLNTSPRIVEMDSDAEDLSESLGATLSVNPIVEEPDDFPSNSKSNEDTSSRMHRQQQYPHAFAYRTVHMRPPVYAMPTNAYYQAHYHQQAYPQAYVYAQPTHPHHHMHHPHHHHAHPHMNQQQAQQFYHPHAHSQAHAQAFIHQFYPMMSAQGILIEVIENDGINHVNENGANISMNENSTEIPEQLYLVTINGQRQVMTEDQIRRLVADIHQQQLYQTYQQQTASAQQQQQQAQQNFQAPPPQPPPPTQSTQDNLFYAP